MKSKNWFWGILFLLSAIFVIASQVDSFKRIGLLSYIATALLLVLAGISLFDLNFFGAFIPLAFIYMIFQQPLGMVRISAWLLLFAAVLTSIGFSILFRRHPKHKAIRCCEGNDKGKFSYASDKMDGNLVYAKVSFGSSSKYVHSDCLKRGEFHVSFGFMEVYFDQAQLSPEGAEVFVDVSFGAIELYIPRHWNVENNVHASLGGVEEARRFNNASENSPKLTLTGNVSLGGLEINYI